MISPEFKKPRKILITGSVGSGKSTCARKLAEKTGLPYYELDSIAHPEEGSPEGRSPEEQRAVLEKIDQGGFWIMEGTDRKHQRYLFDWAERIIFLDTPPNLRRRRIIRRFIRQKLGRETCLYTPTVKVLRQMFLWSAGDEKGREAFLDFLSQYGEKVRLLSDSGIGQGIEAVRERERRAAGTKPGERSRPDGTSGSL
jgi:adenylate kinase family enzyme